MSFSEFERARDAIIREIDRAAEATIKRALKLLNELRREVLSQIQQAGNLESEVFRMRQVEASINRIIDQFENELSTLMNGETRAQFDRGIALVDKPLSMLDISTITGISREAVIIAEQFNADLITGLIDEIRNKINSILRRAVLGGIDFQQALNEIGRSLDSRGVFSSVAGRAEAILRTELLRIQSQATQMRMEQQNKSMAAAGYELMKGWLATHDLRVRPAHLAAELVYLDNPIAVDEPFTVDGEELMYPRDPAGSPENTINCRCTSTPVVKRIAVQKAA